jgi:hypothetical protein
MIARIRPRQCNNSPISINQALTDCNLLGAALGDAKSWSRWLAVLRAAFALPMTDADRTIFADAAGGRAPPTHAVQELWAVVGRRSGKTRIAAAISTYIGAIKQHHLAPGEVGFVLLLAASRSQASVAFEYVKGFLEQSPILRSLIVGVTASEVRLKGNIAIGVATGSYRTIRGRTLLAVVADETSFWRDEQSAQPDVEIYRACAPALAAARGIWVGISTGYRKVGLLYAKWRDHYAQNTDDILVVQGPSETFNPTLDPNMIARAKAADPETAESEWSGGFRSDIAAFLDDQTIDRAIDEQRPLELPPQSDINYKCFVDASGGRGDAYTICVAHRADDRFVADVVRGKSPPFDPQHVTRAFAALAKEYHVREVTGDAYGAEWVEQAWRDCGLNYVRSERNKSALYVEALPLFTRGVIVLPDHKQLIRELRLLKRRTSRTGKDIVDHGRAGSDDYCNATCGALVCCATRGKYIDDLSWVGGDDNVSPIVPGRMPAILTPAGPAISHFLACGKYPRW